METNVVTIISEASNKLVARIEKNDEEFNNIVNQIQSITDDILDENVDNSKKYDKIVSIEYLLVKARLNVEFEHLKVKSILSNPSTPAAIRGILIKRDSYLATVSVKLNGIRDDISTLQKVVYVQSTRNIR